MIEKKIPIFRLSIGKVDTLIFFNNKLLHNNFNMYEKSHRSYV